MQEPVYVSISQTFRVNFNLIIASRKKTEKLSLPSFMRLKMDYIG